MDRLQPDKCTKRGDMWGPPLKKLCVLLLDYLGCFTGSHVKSLYGRIAALVFFHFLSACEPKPFLSWYTSRFLIPWVGIVYKPDCHCEAHGHQLGGHYLEEGRAQCTSSHCRGHWGTLLRSELVIVSPSASGLCMHLSKMASPTGFHQQEAGSQQNGFTNRLHQQASTNRKLEEWKCSFFLQWVLCGGRGGCVQIHLGILISTGWKHRSKRKTSFVLSLAGYLEFKLAFKKNTLSVNLLEVMKKTKQTKDTTQIKSNSSFRDQIKSHFLIESIPNLREGSFSSLSFEQKLCSHH